VPTDTLHALWVTLFFVVPRVHTKRQKTVYIEQKRDIS